MALTLMCVLLVISTVLTTVASKCEHADGSKIYSFEWKVMVSDVVADGKVISLEPDNDLTNSNIAKMEIRCIYKGERLDEIIWISQVGYNSKNCLTTNMTVGNNYLIYLKKENGKFYQEFKPEIADNQQLDEIIVLCEVTITYPKGYDYDNNKETCPEKAPDDECIPKPNITNPSYSGVKDNEPVSDGATNQQQIDDDKEEAVSDKAMESPQTDDEDKSISFNKPEDGNNGYLTLTCYKSILVCLLLAVTFKL